MDLGIQSDSLELSDQSTNSAEERNISKKLSAILALLDQSQPEETQEEDKEMTMEMLESEFIQEITKEIEDEENFELFVIKTNGIDFDPEHDSQQQSEGDEALVEAFFSDPSQEADRELENKIGEEESKAMVVSESNNDQFKEQWTRL
jgi:hypothetical protein